LKVYSLVLSLDLKVERESQITASAYLSSVRSAVTLDLIKTYALKQLSSFHNLRRKGGKFDPPPEEAKGPDTPLARYQYAMLIAAMRFYCYDIGPKHKFHLARHVSTRSTRQARLATWLRSP